MLKKISGKVGIIEDSEASKKKAPGARKKNTRGAATMFWQVLVKVWFDLYAELMPPVFDDKAKEYFPAEPVFDGPETKNMKLQLKVLRIRAEKRNVEWTEEEAKRRFEAYIRLAWEDDFCSKHFCFRGFSVRKNQIFNNQITPKKNGTSQQHTIKRIEPTAQSERDFGEL